MDSPYPTYQAIYNSTNPNQAAANLLNNYCSQCAAAQQPGGYTAISPQIANPPPPNFLEPPRYAPGTEGMEPPRNNMEETMPSPFSVPSNLPQDPQLTPITDLNQPMPMSAESLQYLNGFMRTQIGRRVRVEFLVGTNTITDRTGILVAVGANFILINETETDDLLACDFYNIKFIKFYY